MDNPLVTLSYDDFLRLAQTAGGAGIRLDTGAALSLCRNGIVRTSAPLAWLALFWVSLIAMVLTFFFCDWRFIAFWVFLAWLGARRSKRSAVSAVWREIKGQGAMSRQERENIYTFLVGRGMLFLSPKKELS